MKLNDAQKKTLKRKRALELVTGEIKPKYPKNSKIQFSGSCNKGEEPVTVSCSWYNKVGRPDGKVVDRKNIVSSPPEWQNITYEEAKKISEMFDDCSFLIIQYV